jgi:hypothetical protein
MDLILNFGSLFLLVATLIMVGYFVLIYLQPTSSLNFLGPTVFPTYTARPTLTPIIPSLSATLELTTSITNSETPEVTDTPTSTQPPTIVSVSTATLAPTPLVVTPLSSPTKFVPNPATPTYTPVSGTMPFVVYQEDIVPMESSIFEPLRSYGCDYMGVGGQVLDKNGSPLVYQQVQLKGYLEGSFVNYTVITGSAQHFGPAGFQFDLADHPIATKGTLQIFLVSQDERVVSSIVNLDTYDDCTKNLILITFRQIK